MSLLNSRAAIRTASVLRTPRWFLSRIESQPYPVLRLYAVCLQIRPLTAASERPPRAHGRRVLIVEDNVDSAESLAMLLSVAGHDVRTTHDGVGALIPASPR
jgi:hypothetical protein